MRKCMDFLIIVVLGSFLSQAQSGTLCGFSQSDSNTPPHPKPRCGGTKENKQKKKGVFQLLR